MYVLTAQGRHACAPLSLYLPLGQASHAEFADPVLYLRDRGVTATRGGGSNAEAMRARFAVDAVHAVRRVQAGPACVRIKSSTRFRSATMRRVSRAPLFSVEDSPGENDSIKRQPTRLRFGRAREV